MIFFKKVSRYQLGNMIKNPPPPPLAAGHKKMHRIKTLSGNHLTVNCL